MPNRTGGRLESRRRSPAVAKIPRTADTPVAGPLEPGHGVIRGMFSLRLNEVRYTYAVIRKMTDCLFQATRRILVAFQPSQNEASPLWPSAISGILRKVD